MLVDFNDYDRSVSLSASQCLTKVTVCYTYSVSDTHVHTHTLTQVCIWDMIIYRHRLKEGITHWYDLERLICG